MTTRSRLLPTAIAAAALALMSLQAQAQQAPAAPAVAAAAPVAAQKGVFAKAIATGLYETVYSTSAASLFVASSAGAVYRVDPQTLEVQQKIDLPQKPFALAIDNKAGVLYVGHTIDSSISAIDVATGQVRATAKLEQLNAEGKPIHVRQIAVDESTGTLFVGGVDKTGIVWALDGKTLAVKHVLHNPNLKSIGLEVDAASGQLYTSGGAGYDVLDGKTLTLKGEHRVAKPSADAKKDRYFINVAYDARTGRLFANDSSQDGELFVFDAQSGKELQAIKTGRSPVGVRFNPVRNEVYVANREGGTVTVVDAASYAVKHQVALVGKPNSLAVSPDGQAVYVTVKQSGPRGTPPSPEQLVRLDLKAL